MPMVEFQVGLGDVTTSGVRQIDSPPYIRLVWFAECHEETNETANTMYQPPLISCFRLAPDACPAHKPVIAVLHQVD
jgi:hypothetical protein